MRLPATIGIVDNSVGSSWPAVWSMVTVGAMLSKWTELSLLVEAVLLLPARSAAAAAGIEATTRPSPVIPLTLTV